MIASISMYLFTFKQNLAHAHNLIANENSLVKEQYTFPLFTFTSMIIILKNWEHFS